MGRYVRHHVNYQSRIIYDGLVGVVDLNREVAFYAESDSTRLMGYISLRYVLYKFMKLSNGHSLIGEICQENNLASVDIVIANAPEAETMVAMMNKNLAAYLTHYLKVAGLNGDFIRRLVNASIDPLFLHSMGACTWNSETNVLSTPDDIEQQKEQDIEAAAWYKDEFGDHMKDKERKAKKQYAALEQFYDLDGTHSVQTIHVCAAGKGYAGTPGAATFNLGDKVKADEVID